MEERPAETNANVDKSASPSVAQLAVRFKEQAAATKEKSLPNASHPPKVKVKSSPLIEKLQANLAFDPTALLPGASPKSPGLKAVVSPFQSPPSTPSSPGVWPRTSEAEEVPVSFDQPPEGSHLPCYNKVRTRGSIKRRPPSRRFRRSQSDCGDLGDFRAPELSQENGAKEENGDELCPIRDKTPGSPSPSEGLGEQETRRQGSSEKPPLLRSLSRTEKLEEKVTATEEALHPEPAVGNSKAEATDAPQTSSSSAENGCVSPVGGSLTAEQTEEPADKKDENAQNGDEPPAQRSQGEAAVLEETPQIPPGEMESSDTADLGAGTEKPEEEAKEEISKEVPKPEENTPVLDTEM